MRERRTLTGEPRALLREADDGNIVAILPQFVVFEVSYVLQSLYNQSGPPLDTYFKRLVLMMKDTS